MQTPSRPASRSLSRTAAIFVATALIEIAVFLFDDFKGPLISAAPYYFIPIGIAVWYLNLPLAALFVAASALAREYVFSRAYPHNSWLPYATDLVSSGLIFSTVAALLAWQRRSQRLLVEQARELEVRAQHAEHQRQVESRIRRAVLEDVPAIVELAVYGASDGDLSKEVLAAERQQALQASYNESILSGMGERPTWSGGKARVPLELWVYELDGKIVGFFMILGLDQQAATARELHAVAIDKAYRGAGVGTAMVDFFCSHYYGRRLYAACMPGSRMHGMLQHRGFFHHADAMEGYVIVERTARPREKGLLAKQAA